MGAKTDIFPSFSELCASARDVEKKPLSIPPRQIDGKLVLDENFGIFPREFDEYTYSFLLFEAQKIERQLNVDAISSSQQDEVASPRRLTPEQQMENDLHKFVSAQEREQAALDAEAGSLPKPLQERKAPVPSEPDEVADYEREHMRMPGPDDADAARDDELVPVPEKEVPPLPERRAEAPALPQAKPRVLPPKMPMGAEQKKPSLIGAPSIPLASPAAKPWQAEPPAQPPMQKPLAWQSAPKIPVSKPAEQDDVFEQPPSPQQAAEPEKVPDLLPAAEAEKKPPAGISSYSKLSPRLRAIIEQKLRREEEKAKKTRDDADIFKAPPPPPEKEPSEEEEQEDMDAPNAWNVRDEEEKGKGSGDVLPVQEDEEKEAPAPARERPRLARDEESEEQEAPARERPRLARDEESEEQEAPARERPRLARDEESDGESPVPEEEEQVPIVPFSRKEDVRPAKTAMPSDEPKEEDGEEKQTAPSVPEEKEEDVPPARSLAQQGPVMIKPMFPDSDSGVSAPSNEKQEISREEDSDRMRRIQRIIEELSPDRARAKPKQEEVSFEKQAASEQPLLQEEADVDDEAKGQDEEASAVQKPAPAKKSEATSAPMKKAARAQRKKAADAQEKEAPAPARERPRIAREEESEAPKEKAALKGQKGAKGKQIGVPLKKLQSKAPVEEETEEIPAARKSPVRLPAREEEAQEDEEKEAPAPARAKLRLARDEEEDEEKEAPSPAPRKLAPRLPMREEESEEQQAPARARPRIAREEESEEQEESPRPMRKLMPRIPPREEEGGSEDDPEAPAAVLPRRRILPGMARTAPSLQQTYVPPARERKQIPLPAEEPDEKALQEDVAEEKAASSPVSSRFAPLKPRKIASDETPLATDKSPEQMLQDQKMAKMAEQLARLEAGRVKEVAGTAKLPDDETDIPLPDENEGVPKPEDYEQAKESLRKTLEHVETARKVKQEDEAIVEQYAKDHLVWLYEIYKMGGMAREDFLQKASEKYSEAQTAAPASAAGAGEDAPPNPALAALSKEIEKKDKK